MINYQNIDIFELLKTIEDKSIDVVICDPPYYKVVNQDWDKSFADWSAYASFLKKTLKEARRVLTDNGSIFLFGFPAYKFKVYDIFKDFFDILNDLRWQKITYRGMQNSPKKLTKYLNDYEFIFFGQKKDVKIYSDACDSEHAQLMMPLIEAFRDAKKRSGANNDDFYSLVGSVYRHYFSFSQFEIPTFEKYQKLRHIMPYPLGKNMEIKKEYEEIKKEYEHLRRRFSLDNIHRESSLLAYSAPNTNNSIHPTEKPFELIKYLLEPTTTTNYTVLDMFAGSGVAALACMDLELNYIGAELDKEMFTKAQQRINQYKPQLTLF